MRCYKGESEWSRHDADGAWEAAGSIMQRRGERKQKTRKQYIRRTQLAVRGHLLLSKRHCIRWDVGLTRMHACQAKPLRTPRLPHFVCIHLLSKHASITPDLILHVHMESNPAGVEALDLRTQLDSPRRLFPDQKHKIYSTVKTRLYTAVTFYGKAVNVGCLFLCLGFQSLCLSLLCGCLYVPVVRTTRGKFSEAIKRMTHEGVCPFSTTPRPYPPLFKPGSLVSSATTPAAPIAPITSISNHFVLSGVALSKPFLPPIVQPSRSSTLRPSGSGCSRRRRSRRRS